MTNEHVRMPNFISNFMSNFMPDIASSRQCVLRSVCAVLAVWLASCSAIWSAEPWKRHVIDDSSRGADGVRLADVNGDGLLDVVTGWEEGGVIRAYRHPGHGDVTRAWPAVTVGRVRSPEDAVFVDLDRDGQVDVVSCCEGKTRTMFVHWAPKDPSRWLQADAWQTEAIPATMDKQPWMFAVPMQLDGQFGPDLLVGSKGGDATVGWLQAPRQPRNLDGWRFQPLYQAGWIMSLIPWDVDGDGDQDVVVSDRKGKHRGILWLENPGADACAAGQAWPEHRLGGEDYEVMFIDVADLNADGKFDLVAATHQSEVLILLQKPAGEDSGKDVGKVGPLQFEKLTLPNPFGLPNGKAVRVGDIDLDGHLDIVHTTEPGGDASQPGVTWLRSPGFAGSPSASEWKVAPISDARGVKFDIVQLIDLDGDGDLDVLTCEERHNLGVVWYENPTNGNK